MLLSRAGIESIAYGVLAKYYGTSRYPLRAVCVDGFVSNYLGMSIKYTDMSIGNRIILGLTAYDDVEVVLDSRETKRVMTFKKDTIYLHSSLLSEGMRGRRNFTLAHECGHRLLCGINGSETMTHSLRYGDEECVYDLSEWRANTFAGAFLMPEYLMRYYISVNREGKPFRLYENQSSRDIASRDLNEMAAFFGVSFSAMRRRLTELGLAVSLPYEAPWTYGYYVKRDDEEWENISLMKRSALQ